MSNDVVYTVKEAVTKMADQNAKMEARQVRMETILQQILDQAIKTNGRITKNEGDISGLKTEHARWKAIFSTITVVLGGVWTLITFVFK